MVEQGFDLDQVDFVVYQKSMERVFDKVARRRLCVALHVKALTVNVGGEEGQEPAMSRAQIFRVWNLLQIEAGGTEKFEKRMSHHAPPVRLGNCLAQN